MFRKKESLFKADMEPRCPYCAKGSILEEGKILCSKKGVMDAGSQCRSFRYDPLKRVPPKPAALNPSKHSPEEFRLD